MSRDEMIVQMRQNGVLIREICEETGVSKNTVLKVLREAGVENHKVWYDNAQNLSLEQLTPMVVEEYTAGNTMKQVAETLGMRIDAVRRILREEGVSPSGKLLSQGINSPEERTKAIVALRNQGLTYDQIVAELGVCKSIVYRTCKKEGVNRPVEKGSEELEQLIISLYKKGIPAKKIRSEVHKNYEYVQSVLEQNGYIKSGKEKRKERNEKIVELRNAGVSVADIADQVGINRFSVYHILREIDKKEAGAPASEPLVEQKHEDAPPMGAFTRFGGFHA